MLRNITLKLLLFFFTFIVLLSFTANKVQKKVIRDANFDTHFYVYIDKRKTDRDAYYYWYKAGKIHKSYGEAGGELLHSEFIKYHENHQLAEKGHFDYGLKVGLWRQWHPNGNLKEEIHWRSGRKNGDYFYYDQNGKLYTTGQYKRDNRYGVWINIQESDTTWYKGSEEYKEHPRVIKKRLDSLNNKRPFFNKLFRKKDKAKDSTLVPHKRSTLKKDEVQGTKNKPHFFKRLFTSKKDSIK